MATSTPASSSFWDELSQMFGQQAKGAQDARVAQGTYENARDNTAARIYDIAQTARTQAANQALAIDKYRNALAGQGANEAVRGALIENAQPSSLDYGPSHITRMKFSGGTTPASFTPETRAAGAALAAHGTGLLNNPAGAITSLPGGTFLTPPTQSPELQPSFWSQIAATGGLTTGLLGALSKLGGNQGGGNLSDAVKGLKKIFGGGSSPLSSTYSSPVGSLPVGTVGRNQDGDLTPETGGTAYGPGGVPLPVENGGYYDDVTGRYIEGDQNPVSGGGYYDDETGQYIPGG